MNESPRLFNRTQAARYMGICVKTFDKIRGMFAVDVLGNIRYDRVKIDAWIGNHMDFRQ